MIQKTESVLKSNSFSGITFTHYKAVTFGFSQVWQIRVDLHLLNHDGNIIDAASIAAIVALCHFRRPDVSVQGEEVTVVSQTRSQYSISGSCSFLSERKELIVDISR